MGTGPAARVVRRPGEPPGLPKAPIALLTPVTLSTSEVSQQQKTEMLRWTRRDVVLHLGGSWAPSPLALDFSDDLW